ncbi:SDR family NAD(P)-dependent oxidoreductase [Martelella sp. HB161492]|uniref:SDR family NAD(P)-dependent oxidoreductase n=1 Tax=Martelella sp. HB161492 TaxID=2720726 RepID=UPI0015907BC0|nr:SDR family NAD(P)-dependent oxidoreductase [Martelella sp. HB161492]
MTKVWLITGSAHGLGESIARAAIEAGDRVVATARRPAELQPLLETFGENLRPFALDVTDEAAAKAAVDFAVESFGRLDILVNNAGYGQFLPFEQASLADFRAQIETNLFGVVNTTHAALPVMRAQRSGHIINISSIGGRVTSPGMAAYQSAKWAVSGFSEVIAKETAAFGIHTISVEPGSIRTNWGKVARGDVPPFLPDYQTSMGAMADLLKQVIGHETGDPDRIAAVILDLSRRDDLPDHLVLGTDALTFLKEADEKRLKEGAAWEAISRSIDFDDADFSAIGRFGKLHG